MKKYELTEEHRAQLKHYADKWIANAMSTKEMDEQDKSITRDSIKKMYALANLTPPPEHRIVFVPSPIMARYVAGFAAAIWYLRKNKITSSATSSATRAATEDATWAATEDATSSATRAATEDATWAATEDATWDATSSATKDATSSATKDATSSATKDATSFATLDATELATWGATLYATRAATEFATWAATSSAIWAATRAAIWDATSSATSSAISSATLGATRDATWGATSSATSDATWDTTWDTTMAATWSATEDETRAATMAATWSAASSATMAATMATTWDATRAATWDATWDATNSATEDATLSATRAATLSATEAATEAATNSATEDATENATWDAVEDATLSATLSATWDATWDATWSATRAATNDKKSWYNFNLNIFKKISFELKLGNFGLKCANSASYMMTMGNQYSYISAMYNFFKEVAKLDIDWSKWEPYELASIHSGPRFMHSEFCIVSDRPKTLLVDEQNRPHNFDGPFCEWRDGSALYSIHGIRVPMWICETKREDFTKDMILKETNADYRRCMIQKIGMERCAELLDYTVIDKMDDYELITFDVGDGRIRPYLKMKNPSIDAIHIEGCHPSCDTVKKALAWRNGTETYIKPEVLT